jgi:hypothetical protein
MQFLPNYFAPLYGSILLVLEAVSPGFKEKHAVSASLAVLIILVIIAMGALFVYVIISTKSTTTTTSPYQG